MTDFRRLLTYYPVLLLLLFGVLLSGARAGLLGIMIAILAMLVVSPTVRKTLISRDSRVWLVLVAGLALSVAVVFGLSIKPSSRAAEYFAAPQASVTVKESLLASNEANPSRLGLLVADTGGEDGATPPPTIGRFGPGDESAAESDGVRRQYIEDSLTYIADRPLTGYGFRWIESSHNIYLQLLLSGGILALAGFLLFVFGYLRAGFRTWGSVPEDMDDTARAATVSVALMLITGMVGNVIVDRYVYLPFALVFAMWVLTADRQSAERVEAAGEAVR
jgi:hypothetical protein